MNVNVNEPVNESNGFYRRLRVGTRTKILNDMWFGTEYEVRSSKDGAVVIAS